MTLPERLRALLAHHGIERAHLVGGGIVNDLIELCIAAPDLAASLTLVCPMTVPQTLARDLAVPLGVVSGDRGKGAEMIDSALAASTKPHRVVLAGYEPLLWTDIAAERTNEIRSALLGFLSRVDREIALTPITPEQAAGSVAGLAYQVHGKGPPLLLFPLGLAPSQWQPLLEDLAGRYSVFSISGAHTEPVSLLEDRASNPGYQAVLGSVLDRIGLVPGKRLLEVGCGCGAVSRVLAEQTGRANPITGVDLNRFLLAEAALLRDAAGLGPLIDFKEGDAHALPFADASFDGTISITMLEEVDADRALAEMVRVTRPGGRVGVVVRAIDIAPVVGVALPEPILAKVRAGLHAAGAGPDGCADTSLYRRMAAAGLTSLFVAPQLNCFAHLRPATLSQIRDSLDPDELEVWTEAVAAEGEAFFLSKPMHAAVGTKPAAMTP